MISSPIDWLELAIATPVVGAVCVGFVRSPVAASQWCLWFSGATLSFAVVTGWNYFAGVAPHGLPPASGWRSILVIDEFNAALLPLVALLHFLTALATARTKMARFSFGELLVAEAVRMAAFACVKPLPLVGLLALDVALPYFEIRRRGGTGRLYAIHAGLFVATLFVGWAMAYAAGWHAIGSVFLLIAVLVRSAALPAHVWLTDLFRHGSFGTALLFNAPLAGVFVAFRLFFPVAGEWMLEALGAVALTTAVYAAAMSVTQQSAREFFAYLLVSHGSLVLMGIALHSPFALTGALVMWLSSALSLTGLGLTMRAMEARVGSLSLAEFRGLYDQSPALAVCFLVTGLAAVGFPGTSGFVAAELLVDEAVGAHLVFGLGVVLATALNGIAVIRAYLLLFTGSRHETGVSLAITPRERVAVLTLASLLLGGGLLPQVYVESRNRAAETGAWRTTSQSRFAH